MDIRIKKIKLANFKGLKKFTFEPNGKNATISAENGKGKTTVYDAFIWALFGKDSSGDAKFGIRPVDGDNNAIKGLVVSVELTLDIDGKECVIVREHHEKIIKKQVRGFTDKCSIDEVELPITKYNARIAELVPAETFKLLTDTDFFNDDDKFHWNKRRGVLLDLAGEISSPKGFEGLLEAIGDREIEDYKKILKTRIKAFSDKRDEINPRIDENQLKLDDYAENAVDVTELEKQRHDLKNDLEALNLQRKNIIDDQDARQVKIDDLNELKDSLATRERALKNDTSGVQGLLDEKAEILKGVADKLALATESSNAMGYKKTEIVAAQRIVDSRQSAFVAARDAYLDAKNTPIEEPPAIEGVCFNCNQPLPEEMKESSGADRQKAIDLLKSLRVTELQNLGDAARTAGESVKEQRLVIETLEADLVILKDDLDKAQIVLEESEAYRDQRVTGIDEALSGQKPIDTSKDSECMAITANIATAEAEIGEPAGEQLEEIEDKRVPCQRDLESVNVALLAADAIKAVQPRINELKTEETELAQKIADCEKELEDIKNYNQAECLLIESAVNDKFKHVNFRLFKELLKTKDGSNEADTVPCCDAMLNGVVYSDMSDGEKIFAGIDIINVLSKHYDMSVPLFIDRAETFTKDRESTCQVIELHAVKGVTALEVKVNK